MSFEDWSGEDPFDDRYYDDDDSCGYSGGGYHQRTSKRIDTVSIHVYSIIRETAKAVLFDVCVRTGGSVAVWIPKFCMPSFSNFQVTVREDFWDRKKTEVADEYGHFPDDIGLKPPKKKQPKKKSEKKRGKSMQSKQLVHLIQEGYTTVLVNFKQDGMQRGYTYKTNLPLEVDDIVVVPANGYFKTAQVVEVHEEPQIDLDSDIDYKWVVQKVDTVAYNELLKKEDELSKKIKNFEHKQRRGALLASLGISSDNSELLALTHVGTIEKTK